MDPKHDDGAPGPGAAPASTRGPKASAADTPTMKRKNGKIRSVGVQPCQPACSSGQ